MKALSIAIVAGVLLVGAVSAGAQFLLPGRTFHVVGGVFEEESKGDATFGVAMLQGAYWDEGYWSGNELSSGSWYLEIPRGPTQSLAVALRRGHYQNMIPLICVDVFYVWRDGTGTHFFCLPTVNLVPIGFLMGTEITTAARY